MPARIVTLGMKSFSPPQGEPPREEGRGGRGGKGSEGHGARASIPVPRRERGDKARLRQPRQSPPATRGPCASTRPAPQDLSPSPPVTPLSPRPAPCPGLQVAKARSGGRPGLPGTGTCGTRGTLPPPTAASASSGVRARGGDSDISLPRGAPPAPGSAERPGDTPATRGDTPEPNPGTAGGHPSDGRTPPFPRGAEGEGAPSPNPAGVGGINASLPPPRASQLEKDRENAQEALCQGNRVTNRVTSRVTAQ